MDSKQIKDFVKEGYAKVATQSTSCCRPATSCCGSANLSQDISKKIGYSDEELQTVPEGANLGLGCGNPLAFSSIQEGETVLDLGSGAGFDSFLAAAKVGQSGKVIGVDMTPEMVEKAKENAKKGNYQNVEFRLGEIENLPVADSSVDLVISNCVINLSPDKSKVFQEAFRVLKPGGKLTVSDIVLLKELPSLIRNSIEAYIGCLSGAVMKDKYLKTIESANFQDIRVLEETYFPVEYMANDPTAKLMTDKLNLSSKKIEDISDAVASIRVSANKPMD